MSHALVAHPSPVKLILLFFGSVGFVVLGAWMLLGGEILSARAHIAAIACIIFFGLCSIYIGRMVFQRNSAIEVSQKGILFRRWSDDTIAWDDIAEIMPYQVGRQELIGLQLYNPKLYPGRGVQGILAKANKGFSGYDISIATVGTDTTVNAVLAAITEFSGPPR